MEFETNKAISVLEKTPSVLRTLLEDLAKEWIHQNEGENTWSPYDIVGHLIHGEKTDWIARAEIILENDLDKKFESFDRFAQFENSKGKSLNQLLDEFEKLRIENLNKLKQMDLSTENLTLEGIHPEFGPVTLKQLLATWVAHDLNHIAQISRVMAKQFKTEVGPWKEYLGILKK
jgi:uncharacterized damage-inducible protein DinB